MDDEDHIRGLKNTARLVKARRAAAMREALHQGPKPPTFAQRDLLFFLLGSPTPIQMEAYVRFACGYFPGKLTMWHYSQAIQLHKEKINAYGLASDLLELSFDPNWECEPNTGEDKRRIIARAKAIKAKTYAGASRISSGVGARKPPPSSTPKSTGPKPSSPAEARAAQLRGAMELLAKRRQRFEG